MIERGVIIRAIIITTHNRGRSSYETFSIRNVIREWARSRGWRDMGQREAKASGGASGKFCATLIMIMIIYEPIGISYKRLTTVIIYI